MIWTLFLVAAVPDFALFDAVIDGRRGRVEKLLARGADPDAVSAVEDGSVLAVAAGRGRDEIVEVLLDAGADLNAASGQNADTALHRAACMGERATVRVLLDHGALPDVRDATGSTPLSCAGPATRDLLQRSLRALGLDIERDGELPSESTTGPETLLEGRGVRSVAPLPEIIEAAWANDARRIADILRTESVASRAPPGHVLGGVAVPAGSTSLHVAVGWGRFNAVGLLLAHGADVHAIDEHGRTPLHVAVWKGRQAIAWGLLSAGADPATGDKSGLTPMDYAAWRGDLAFIEAMMGSAPRATVQAAALSASARGHVDVVVYLWDSDLDAEALMERAVLGDHWAVVLVLVERSALDLERFLETAVQSGASGAAAILVRRGAHEARWTDEMDPLMQAAVAGFLGPNPEQGPDARLADVARALEEGDLNGAYRDLVLVEQQAPWLPRAQRLLGAHAMLEGDEATAAEHYRLAQRLDPSDGQAAEWLARHLERSNEKDDP